MLSKAVKERRRYNRALRSEPAWKVCMRSYKMQQLVIVRLHVQHLENMVVPEDADGKTRVAHVIKLDEKKKDIEQLKHQQKHMTREEWYAELDQLQGHHCDQRAWVKLLLEGEQDAQ
jgi:hypothetical protein